MEKDGKKQKKTTKHYAAIGVTSGTVFLGLIGGAGSRREYSVLGDKVNLAARLMCLCKKYRDTYGEVVVDESIVHKLGDSMDHLIEFKLCAETYVKGKVELIKVYKPKLKKHCIRMIQNSSKHGHLLEESDLTEFSQCYTVIEDMHRNRHGRVVFVEAEAGICLIY